MKIAQCIEAAYPSQEHGHWSVIASTVAKAIIERAVSMPIEELRAFIADTSAGKDAAFVGENELASAAVLVKQALL